MSILTPEVRTSYCNLFVARAHKDADVGTVDKPQTKTFSTSLLIPKSTPEVSLNEIRALYAQVRDKAFPDGFKYGATGTEPFIDGAIRYPQDPTMHDFYILGASAKESEAPTVVKAQLDPTTNTPVLENGVACLEAANASEVYSGCWGVAVLNPYAYFKGKSGMVWSIEAFKKTRDDVSLGTTRLDGKTQLANHGLGILKTPVDSFNTAPAPAAPAAPAAPVAKNVMTDKADAEGITYEALVDAGWDNEQMIDGGYLAK